VHVASGTITDEGDAGIDAQCAAERPRGAQPRWWEDVRAGATTLQAAFAAAVELFARLLGGDL
jgi:hypothetical protein